LHVAPSSANACIAAVQALEFVRRNRSFVHRLRWP
jgi:hypothetical protein